MPLMGLFLFPVALLHSISRALYPLHTPTYTHLHTLAHTPLTHNYLPLVYPAPRSRSSVYTSICPTNTGWGMAQSFNISTLQRWFRYDICFNRTSMCVRVISSLFPTHIQTHTHTHTCCFSHSLARATLWALIE